MIYWALLLHFYQPPTQTHDILNKVSAEAYRPLIDVFRRNPNARASVNINAVLTEMFAEHGKQDIIDGLAGLAKNRQIEFTGSGKYHPILPLIPFDERDRQVRLNKETNRALLGAVYQPRGFFPPEMCYGKNVVESILNSGCAWVIMSGIACPVEWPLDSVHYVSSTSGKLSVLFRDDVLSNRIAFREIDAAGFIDHLVNFSRGHSDIYVITALDAETFGHHIKGWETEFLEAVFRKLASQQSVRTVTVSDICDKFKTGKAILPKASSWSTTEEDLKSDNPYPLWSSPDNRVHGMLKEHLRLAKDMVDRAVSAADNDPSRKYASLSRDVLDAALHSDQFWWASRRPQWGPNMINRGLMLQQECLLNAWAAIRESASLTDRERQDLRYRKIASEDIADRLRRAIFE
jgi:alpha-amylase/alpha-mannosidase (GH57 family)